VEGITCTGQFVTKSVAKNLNKLLDKFTGIKKDRFLMGDTDSVYMNLEDVVIKLGLTDQGEILDALDLFSKKILQKAVDKTLEEVRTNLNSYKSYLSMKREKIADSIVICGKKNYFMSVLDNEGFRYKEPEIIMKGIKAVRSDTPALCRESLRESLHVFLNGNNDELIQFISDFRTKFDRFSFEEMASPSGVNGIKQYGDQKQIYKGGTPMHVRASLLYNHYLKEKKLTKKYQEIKDGSKMKLVYLKMPNPIKENVIGAFSSLPPEFNLEKYIDRDAQFVKAFLAPIKIIADAIGWEIEKHNTLADLM
jgi:DNA polymerase elongation subunit (family B)